MGAILRKLRSDLKSHHELSSSIQNLHERKLDMESLLTETAAPYQQKSVEDEKERMKESGGELKNAFGHLYDAYSAFQISLKKEKFFFLFLFFNFIPFLIFLF